jgi:hypothetical protein
VSLPTQYNGKTQDPVGALSGALARLQANRPLRELREIAKGVTKQLPEPIQVHLKSFPELGFVCSVLRSSFCRSQVSVDACCLACVSPQQKQYADSRRLLMYAIVGPESDAWMLGCRKPRRRSMSMRAA